MPSPSCPLPHSFYHIARKLVRFIINFDNFVKIALLKNLPIAILHYAEALTITKFKICQWILVAGSPNLMLAKVSCYTVTPHHALPYPTTSPHPTPFFLFIELPTITRSPPDRREIVEGEENLMYMCEFEGYPTPRIDWYFNGEPISSDRGVSISENTLTIASPQTSNSGIYQCIVSNDVGDAQAAWLLEIRQPSKWKQLENVSNTKVPPMLALHKTNKFSSQIRIALKYSDILPYPSLL